MDRLELMDILNYDESSGIFTWKVRKCGRNAIHKIAGSSNGKYIRIVINYKKFYAHRLAWFFHYGDYPSGIIDHINGDKTDNRICNLRNASYSENGMNRFNQTNNTSGTIGVSFSNTRNRWLARIVKNYKPIHLGYFKDKDLAISAYTSAKKQLFPEL